MAAHIDLAEFRSYFEYCRSLRFEDRPDYAYLKVTCAVIFLCVHVTLL